MCFGDWIYYTLWQLVKDVQGKALEEVYCLKILSDVYHVKLLVLCLADITEHNIL
jgi:hypothetical protein